ncbi:Sigma-70 region 2 [Thermanaeromonas toyohensis ToBE]|uniref:Sigma-70 region 2 n=1 Tax=Thermanaeromonas toyohensis ToBE TaxID=698762 RepID=A0A1W1VTG7_9FIRM|nr:sigma factor [Thermanaeromonas toyohensis]SMB96648.1 Sigma-70 region 2 [Thermanaeromonas toyohensis ToBE]
MRKDTLMTAAVLGFLDMAEAIAARVRLRSWWDRQDLAAAAREGLVRAVLAYTPDRGPFAAFAVRCVENAVVSEARHLAREKAVPSEQLPREYAGTDPEEACPGLPLELKGKDRALAELLLAGYDKGECARLLGVSPSWVSRRCRVLARRLAAQKRRERG